MNETNAREAVGRAGRRAAYHLLQAMVEGLKAIEAVIEELGSIKESPEETERSARERIEVE